MKHRNLLIAIMSILVISTITLMILMKREEAKFMTTDGQKFNIMSLELPLSKTYIEDLVTNLSQPVKDAVVKNLKLDNIFTFSWYPLAMTISILAAMSVARARRREQPGYDSRTGSVSVILVILLVAQFIAFILDRMENAHMLKWVTEEQVNTNLQIFKTLVWAKFLLTIPGVITALIIWLVSARKDRDK